MNERLAAEPAKRSLLDPYVFGTLCGLLSAVMYTFSNAFLRAVDRCDPFWVSGMKAVPTVLCLGPLVAYLAWRGRRLFPSAVSVFGIMGAGLIAQVGGNASFQWALGEIGVALAVPLTLGGMILAAATLGRVFLHEPVTPKVAAALGLLLAAVCVLSLGAGEARRSVVGDSRAESDATGDARGSGVDRGGTSSKRELFARTTPDPFPSWRLLAGVFAACFSGLAYSILNVVLRYFLTRGASLPATLFTVSLTGAVSLTSIAWWRLGTAELLATRPMDFGLMLAAGACNTVAFVSLTKSLQLTSIVYVNALNATQATLAAIAGVLIFREALSPWLALGIGLTIAGLFALARAHRGMQGPAEP